MVSTRGGERVVAFGRRKFLSVFEFIEGRELSDRDVRPEHCEQAGRLLAQMHVALRGFSRTRRSRFDPPRVLKICDRAFAGDITKDQQRMLNVARRAVANVDWKDTQFSHIIHSDLFPDNVKFKRDKLHGVFDFEMASRGPAMYDCGIVIVAWAFTNTSLKAQRVRSLMRGYESIRQLSANEQRSLYGYAKLAAARYTISRIHDFESCPRPSEVMAHKDYRVMAGRLRAIDDLGAKRFMEYSF